MNFFTMIVVIVSVIFLTRMIIRVVEAQQSSRTQQASEETLERIQILEKRIANIETILTSKDYHLKKAFEDLENQPEA